MAVQELLLKLAQLQSFLQFPAKRPPFFSYYHILILTLSETDWKV